MVTVKLRHRCRRLGRIANGAERGNRLMTTSWSRSRPKMSLCDVVTTPKPTPTSTARVLEPSKHISLCVAEC